MMNPEYLLSACYFWLEHAKSWLREYNSPKDAKRCLKECETRIKWVEEALK